MNRSTARQLTRVRTGALAGAVVVALSGGCAGGTPQATESTGTGSAGTQSTAAQSTATESIPTQSTATQSPGTSEPPAAAPTPEPSREATTATARSRTTTRSNSSPSTRPAAAPTASRRPAGPTTGASPGRSTTGPARCRPGQVRAAITEADAGAGQRYATLTLRNAGRTRCTVAGYARLQLLSASGAAVPTTVVPSGPARPVTLRPGARAAEQLHWSTVPGPGDPSADRCPATPSRVRVTPGGEAGSVTVAWDLGPVCSGGRIDAEPLRTG